MTPKISFQFHSCTSVILNIPEKNVVLSILYRLGTPLPLTLTLNTTSESPFQPPQ